MTHFGMICPAATDHLNPMTTLGYELKQGGHRVTVFTIEDARHTVLAAGLEFQPVGQLDFPKGATKKISSELGNLSGFKALQYKINLITNDQPGVAARIAWTRTGEFVSLSKLSVEKLRKAIKQVLSEDSYRKNALRLQKAIGQAGGVSRAADIVEQVVSTGKPVFSHTHQNP